MQVHRTSETFGNIVGEMLGWLLGTAGAETEGIRHSHGTASVRQHSAVAAGPLDAAVVEFEVEMIYHRVSSRVGPKRFGRPPFAAKSIIDAEVIENESNTPADTLTR